jgi:hypothetical protein
MHFGEAESCGGWTNRSHDQETRIAAGEETAAPKADFIVLAEDACSRTLRWLRAAFGRATDAVKLRVGRAFPEESSLWRAAREAHNSEVAVVHHGNVTDAHELPMRTSSILCSCVQLK